MAEWLSEAHLLDHFAIHGRKMGFRTPEEYDAGAQVTLAVGRDFAFIDDLTGRDRLGCFDRDSGGLVVLTDGVDDPKIVSYFLANERYCRRQWNSTYDD
jgi:hypothetical protein